MWYGGCICLENQFLMLCGREMVCDVITQGVLYRNFEIVPEVHLIGYIVSTNDIVCGVQRLGVKDDVAT